jgi:hypothetical protein
MDESSMMRSRSRRSPVLLSATIHVAGVPVAVKLRNLSERGALIEGERLPLEGSTALFERNKLKLKRRIVWVEGRYAGVAFDVPLKTEDVLRNIPKPKPKTQQDFRRPGLACRPLTDYERQMLDKWMTSSPVATLGED